MSIIIVAFRGAPQISESAKEKEIELNRRLESKVKGWLVVTTVALLVDVFCCFAMAITFYIATAE